MVCAVSWQTLTCRHKRYRILVCYLILTLKLTLCFHRNPILRSKRKCISPWICITTPYENMLITINLNAHIKKISWNFTSKYFPRHYKEISHDKKGRKTKHTYIPFVHALNWLVLQWKQQTTPCSIYKMLIVDVFMQQSLVFMLMNNSFLCPAKQLL